MKMVSIKRFFAENIERFKRISLGYSFNDKLAILGVAVLQ